MKFFLVLGVLFHAALRTQATVISEAQLVEMLQNSPQLSVVQAQVEALNANLDALNASLAPVMETDIKYNKTNEQTLIIFQPPNQPYYSADLMVRHKTKYGVSYGIGVNGESLTSSDANINSARFNPKVQLSVDLLKNRLGRQTKNDWLSMKSQVRAAQIDQSIVESSLASEVRKLFWNYSILSEKQTINKDIVSLTTRLLNDVKKKKREGFVEAGDLLSAKSQLSGQKANGLLVDYQVELVKKALKQMLPELPYFFELEKASVYGKESVLKVCLSKITSYKKAPKDLSFLKKSNEEMISSYNFKKLSLENMSKPDLSLSAEYSGAHVDPRLRDAFSDFLDQGRYGFSVGLNLRFSLSHHVKKQQKRLLASEKYRLNSHIKESNSKLEAVHQEAKQSIQLLNKALVEQKATTQNLQKSFRFKQKQYRQARSDLFDVLQEQNAYLKSRLNQLDISKMIADLLLDYKAQFQNFECSEVGL